MQKRKYLIWIPIALVFLFTCGFMAYELILSMVKFSPMRGTSGSPFIGLSNYARMFQSALFPTSVGASLLQSVVRTLPSLLLGAGICAVLGMIPSKKIKAGLAAAALMVALVPVIVWNHFFADLLGSTLLRTNGGAIAFSLLTSLIPNTALCVFAGLTLSISTNIPAALGALAGGLIPLLTMMLPDLRPTLLFSNSLTRNATSTMTLYRYQTGLMSAQYSLSGAMTIISTLCNVVLGILPALGIGMIVKQGTKKPRIRETGSGWIIETLIAAVCGLFMMLALSLVFGILNKGGVLPSQNLLATLLMAMCTFPFAFILCTLMISLTRWSDGKGAFSYGLLALLLALSGTGLISGYMLMRNLGMVNTVFAVAFSTFSNPLFIALLILLVMQRPVTLRQTLFLAAGGAFIAAAICAGDYLPGVFYTSQKDLMPLGLVLRQQTMTAATTAQATAAGVGALPGVLTLLSLLIALPGAILVMGGVCGSTVGVQAEEYAPAASAQTTPLGLHKTSITAAFLLPLVTLGIYQFIWIYRMIRSVRSICGKSLECAGEFLLLMFVPFYSWYWLYSRSKAFAAAADEKGYFVQDHSSIYLVLCILGMGGIALLLMQHDINGVAIAAEQDARYQTR